MSPSDNRWMTSPQDPKGYYSALGVKPVATAAEIKKSYRQLAKKYHPDRNKSTSAKSEFQLISEAYNTLGKDDKRHAYDLSIIAQPSAAHAPSAIPDLVKCSVCGVVTAQPRFIIFWSVYSFLLVSRRQGIQGTFCRDCADKQAIRSSFRTWIFGWWAFPRGPFLALDALLRNILGGDQPPFENADVLGRQARALALRGKIPLARSVLAQAMKFVRDRRQMADLTRFQNDLGQGKAARLNNRWHPPSSAAFYMQLWPLVVLFGAMMYGLTIPIHYLMNKSSTLEKQRITAETRRPVVGESWHVSVAEASIYAGPSYIYPITFTLPLFSTLIIDQEKFQAPFISVRWNGNQKGFIEAANISPDTGLEAWKAWCHEDTTPVGETPVILRRASFGFNTLNLTNKTGQDVMVKIRKPEGDTILSLFIQRGVVAEVPALEAGKYTVSFAVGDDFNRRCNTFLERVQSFTLGKPLTLPVTKANDHTPAKVTYTLDFTDTSLEKLDNNVFLYEGAQN